MVKISIPDIKKLKFFAICFNGTDKNIGKLDNLFSLSPTVMYLPSKLQDIILKKLIFLFSVLVVLYECFLFFSLEVANSSKTLILLISSIVGSFFLFLASFFLKQL